MSSARALERSVDSSGASLNRTRTSSDTSSAPALYSLYLKKRVGGGGKKIPTERGHHAASASVPASSLFQGREASRQRQPPLGRAPHGAIVQPCQGSNGSATSAPSIDTTAPQFPVFSVPPPNPSSRVGTSVDADQTRRVLVLRFLFSAPATPPRPAASSLSRLARSPVEPGRLNGGVERRRLRGGVVRVVSPVGEVQVPVIPLRPKLDGARSEDEPRAPEVRTEIQEPHRVPQPRTTHGEKTGENAREPARTGQASHRLFNAKPVALFCFTPKPTRVCLLVNMHVFGSTTTHCGCVFFPEIRPWVY